MQVQDVDLGEEQKAREIYKIYTIRTLARVPASCLIRQADGSVGFFVQRLEEWQDVSALETAMAALRKVRRHPVYAKLPLSVREAAILCANVCRCARRRPRSSSNLPSIPRWGLPNRVFCHRWPVSHQEDTLHRRR